MLLRSIRFVLLVWQVDYDSSSTVIRKLSENDASVDVLHLTPKSLYKGMSFYVIKNEGIMRYHGRL